MVSQHILVVDPSRTVRVTLQIHLRNAGHEVLALESSQQALERLQTLQPVPNLIFVGFQELDEETRSLLKTVRDQPAYQQTRCVLLWRERGQKLPVNLTWCEILPTPFLIQTLFEMVATCWQEKGGKRA